MQDIKSLESPSSSSRGGGSSCATWGGSIISSLNNSSSLQSVPIKVSTDKGSFKINDGEETISYLKKFKQDPEQDDTSSNDRFTSPTVDDYLNESENDHTVYDLNIDQADIESSFSCKENDELDDNNKPTTAITAQRLKQLDQENDNNNNNIDERLHCSQYTLDNHIPMKKISPLLPIFLDQVCSHQTNKQNCDKLKEKS